MPDPIALMREGEMPYQSVSIASMEWNRTGNWRYLRPRFENKTPPCNEGCPAGQDIEAAMVLIGKGKYLEAWELFKQENPFPAVCGRVCYHPCESSCNRGDFDDPLSINALERFMADMASKHGRRVTWKREKRPERVAVIGSGPAGLTCAYHLTRMGYGVTVFEALPVLGGMLRVGIPEYRLPKKILEEEIDQILELGVNAEVNTRLGGNLAYPDLKEFQALFIAVGNHRSKALGIPGEETQGIRSGVEFLRDVSLGKDTALGKRVAVIGGGNTAIDAARTALRLGAKPFILYRRTREEMPAFPAEILEAEEEGIEMSFLVSPVRVLGQNGKIKQLACVKNRLGPPDGDGRRRPVEIKDSYFTLEVDQVVAAIGEDADFSGMPKKLGVRDGVLPIDERGATKLPGVFAGGDITQQPRTVVHAIASGKRAAIFIDRLLKGEKGEGLLEALEVGEKGSLSIRRYLTEESKRLPRGSKTVRLKDLNLDYFEYQKRPKMPKAKLLRRTGSFGEVNLGFSEDTAVGEAKRCFNCGVCNLCDNCYIFCPDVAIHKRGEDELNEIDYDHCKGCGICMEECPRDVVVMEEEGR
jgi:NADPH-dependent glutamate synthase beta subunit-like oxidoreductase/Pyruvate/2-oxoacid:ferredoxin oxidoreductase delta subunit